MDGDIYFYDPSPGIYSSMLPAAICSLLSLAAWVEFDRSLSAFLSRVSSSWNANRLLSVLPIFSYWSTAYRDRCAPKLKFSIDDETAYNTTWNP